MPIQDYYNIVHKKMAVYYVYESANMKYVIKMQIQVNFNYYSETGLFWSHNFFLTLGWDWGCSCLDYNNAIVMF